MDVVKHFQINFQNQNKKIMRRIIEHVMLFWCPLHLSQSGVNCDLDFKLITIKHLLKERFLSWAIEHFKVVQVTKEVKNLTVPTFAQFAIPDVQEICI